MSNTDVEKARAYHRRTSHTTSSVRESGHWLDFSNLPLGFKVYEDLAPLPLTVPAGRLPVATMEALGLRGDLGDRGGACVTVEDTRVPDLTDLIRLLHYSAGITRRIKRRDGSTMPFRAAACTGALYEIDLYVVCQDLAATGETPLPDGRTHLEAGVYHYSVHDGSLRLLRAGDHRARLVEATASEPSVTRAPVIVVSTGTWWRNAWKYRDRTWRHFGWDNGTILANLLALARARDLPARLVCGFVDEQVDALLGLDPAHEVSLSLVALGSTDCPPPACHGPVEPLSYRVRPLSRHEVDYPLMREAHAASCLRTPDEVRAWREAPVPDPSDCSSKGRAPGSPEASGGAAGGTAVDSPAAAPAFPLSCPADSDDLLEDTVLRRGSSRRFARQSIESPQFAAMARAAMAPLEADFDAAWLEQVFLIVHAVDGVPAGRWRARPHGSLESLGEGDFRAEAGRLDLDQDLAADASANVYFMTDLEQAVARYGNRGYRAAQLAAGVMGGRIYLAAYAMRLGATGLTFYDDEVTEFFSPGASRLAPMFLVACGVPYRRTTREPAGA